MPEAGFGSWEVVDSFHKKQRAVGKRARSAAVVRASLTSICRYEWGKREGGQPPGRVK